MPPRKGALAYLLKQSVAAVSERLSYEIEEI
jgi:hypothetical protein